MRKLAGLVLLALVLPGCAVKSYPRSVSGAEQVLVTAAFTADSGAARVAPGYRIGKRYDLQRQTPRVEYSFYWDYRLKAKPTLFYGDTAYMPQLETVRKLSENSKVKVELVKWKSFYVSPNPDFRLRYAGYPEEHTAYAVIARGKPLRRGALVMVHDWAEGDLDRIWKRKKLDKFVAQGYDVALVQLPYHGLRALEGSVFSGEQFFSGEIARVNESICQSVTDVRSMLKYLMVDHSVIGLYGTGLGGLVVLQTAVVEKEFKDPDRNRPRDQNTPPDKTYFIIARNPLTALGELPEGNPLAPVVFDGMKASGLDRDTIKKVLFISSPANFDPILRADHIFIAAGMGNAFVPPEQPDMLIKRWGIANKVWYAGGKYLNMQSGACRKAEQKFMKDMLGEKEKEKKKYWWDRFRRKP